MESRKSKWLRIADVAKHFGVSEETIRRRDGAFSILEIAKPTERTSLVTRESFEKLDRRLTEMAKRSAA
jgi:hypothetical protein